MLSLTLSVVLTFDDMVPFADPPAPCDVGAAAPLDVADLIAEISAAPAVAAAQLAALTPDQRYRQAVAHAAWCDAYDVPVQADRVAAAYEAFICAHRSACVVPVGCPQSADWVRIETR